ncbi:hypothetical protein SAMN05216605_113164 [Pseudomonas abietaniphila]|jgi:hypothetical protein|uniref:Uncharacterized protein n=1 Tax=Pseudomonas abietaniphila TaxID=89065 RepID=A0A1G8KNZ5_9PSED|nr:hypothetical protein SAMN05216605_113164 [Pseudomonas abietaniphila]
MPAICRAAAVKTVDAVRQCNRIRRFYDCCAADRGQARSYRYAQRRPPSGGRLRLREVSSLMSDWTFSLVSVQTASIQHARTKLSPPLIKETLCEP